LVAQVPGKRDFAIDSATDKLSEPDSKRRKLQLSSSRTSLLSCAPHSSPSNVIPVSHCSEDVGFQVSQGVFTPSTLSDHVLVVSPYVPSLPFLV
jgi:hypothetical protein